VIKETATNECPVSLLTLEAKELKGQESSMDLVQQFVRGKILHKSFGTSLHGPDLRDWPARTVDAFVILEGEEAKVENLMRAKVPDSRPQQVRRFK